MKKGREERKRRKEEKKGREERKRRKEEKKEREERKRRKEEKKGREERKRREERRKLNKNIRSVFVLEQSGAGRLSSSVLVRSIN